MKYSGSGHILLYTLLRSAVGKTHDLRLDLWFARNIENGEGARMEKCKGAGSKGWKCKGSREQGPQKQSLFFGMTMTLDIKDLFSWHSSIYFCVTVDQVFLTHAVKSHNHNKHGLFITFLLLQEHFVWIYSKPNRYEALLPAPFKIWPSAPRCPSFLYHCSPKLTLRAP